MSSSSFLSRAQELTGRYLTPWMSEASFDFFAAHVDPLWTRRRLRLEVSALNKVDGDILSLRLRSFHALPAAPAGTHVEISAVIDGVRQRRTYTPLWMSEHELELGIKKIADGRFSSWVHDTLKVGDHLEIERIYGTSPFLQLSGRAAPVLIAGGSGMTLAMALLHEWAATSAQRPIHLIQYARTATELAYLDALAELQTQIPALHTHLALTREPDLESALQGHFCAQHWQTLQLDTDSPVIVCGPAGLVDGVAQVLTDIDHQGGLYREAYHRPLIAASSGAPVSVQLGARQLSVSSQETLLESLEQAGLQPKYGCRQGICMSCTCHKVQGRVQNAIDGSISDDDEEDIRLCISRPLTDIELLI